MRIESVPVRSMDELRVLLFPSYAARGGRRTSAPMYSMNQPYRLQYYTYHPDDSVDHYSIRSVDPALAASAYLTKDEVGEALSLAGSLHQHDYYELLYVLDGEVYQKIENKRHLYTAGSFCLLNRNVRHSEEYNTDFSLLFLQISEDMLRRIHSAFSLHFFDVETTARPTELAEFLNMNLDNETHTEKDYMDFIPLPGADDVDGHMRSLFGDIDAETSSPSRGSSLRVMYSMIEVMSYLSSKDCFTTTPVRIGTDRENSIFDSISEAVRQSSGRISRSELEQQLHYSGAYLNRITHKYTGMSISEYAATFAMKEAARLLETSRLSVQDIALSLSYTNRSHFYRQFEAIYGMTPSAYRSTRR